MAVFPDRIVLKNSTDTDSAIRAAIGSGGTDEISLGEVVVGLAAGSVTFYAKDSAGNIQTIGQSDSALVIVSSSTPTVDNLGNALSDGNLWFNPTTEELAVYSSGAWVVVSGGGGGGSVLTTNGDMLTHNGTESVRLPIGGASKILTSVASKPTWVTLGDSQAAPTVTGVYLDAVAASSTTWDATLPAGGIGDTMVAVIMYRISGGAVTDPAGWNYVNAFGVTGTFGTSDQQYMLLYVKTRDGSEGATATWTLANATEIAGAVYNISGPVNLVAADQASANGAADVSVDTQTGSVANRLLHLNFSHSVFAGSPSTMLHSGTGITAVADNAGATEGLKLATSYVSTDGVTVTSSTNAIGSVGDPNHNIFTLAISEYVTPLYIDSLADVNTSQTPPTDGQVLVWVDADNEWKPADGPTAGVEEAPLDGQYYVRRNGTWVPLSAALDPPVDGGDFSSGISYAGEGNVIDGGDLTNGTASPDATGIVDGGDFNTGTSASTY